MMAFSLLLVSLACNQLYKAVVDLTLVLQKASMFQLTSDLHPLQTAEITKSSR